ncbi:MAG TPA: methyltransferase domain-containing protein [Chloroflexota bacterium]|nr:methyltransferase domain-containing protein [Chloroflexota bacterium]
MSQHLQPAGPVSGDTYASRHARDFESPTSRRARREVYGDDYPEEARPRSFITLSELRRIAGELRVGPGQTIVDLGCGWGGPGLWVARETGAGLVGIDLSSIGVTRAREHAAEVGLAARARFEIGDLTATDLPGASFDGAMSVDVLWSVPDKPAALREIARILRPGARFAFTNWDRDLSPPGYLPPLADHRPLLDSAGFDVETYEVQPDDERLRGAYYEHLVAAEADLLDEIGEEETRKLMASARGNLGLVDGTRYLDHSRRILVVARKRAPL